MQGYSTLRLRPILLLLRRVHRSLEPPDPVPQPLTQFRQFLRTKHQQSNSKNQDKMHRLKQSFNHKSLLTAVESFQIISKFPTRPRAHPNLAASIGQPAVKLPTSSPAQHPVKEIKSPSGFGRVGLNGSNGNDFEVSNPAAPAAVRSTKGSRACTACSILVRQRVLS